MLDHSERRTEDDTHTVSLSLSGFWTKCKYNFIHLSSSKLHLLVITVLLSRSCLILFHDGDVYIFNKLAMFEINCNYNLIKPKPLEYVKVKIKNK